MSTTFDDLLTSIHALKGLDSLNLLKIVMKSSTSVFDPKLNLPHAKYFLDLQAVGDNFLRIKSRFTVHFSDQEEF